MLIVLTPEKTLKNEIFSICKIFAADLSALHVRKPDFSKEEMADYLKQIPKKFYKKIVLHSQYELIQTFKLKGAHLTEKSRKSTKQINFLKRNKIKIVSTSFHDLKEIASNRRKYEYAFLSPIFNSVSKKNYKSAFDTEKLKPFLKKTKNQIIALGGINETNIVLTKQVGFYGAATIGYVWENKNPIKQYKNLISKIK